MEQPEVPETIPRQPKRLARERWRYLAKALRKKQFPGQEHTAKVSSSGRRFQSFGLFEVARRHLGQDGAVENIYKLPGDRTITIIERHQQSFDLKELLETDNTGNVCMWPTEEVLAWYCLYHPDLFQEQKVCELGAGMAGMAGLLLACCGRPTAVCLTDGNQ
eukprot:Ihof_evm6s454 gene=Ihof_evmTU6s454